MNCYDREETGVEVVGSSGPSAVSQRGVTSAYWHAAQHPVRGPGWSARFFTRLSVTLSSTGEWVVGVRKVFVMFGVVALAAALAGVVAIPAGATAAPPPGLTSETLVSFFGGATAPVLTGTCSGNPDGSTTLTIDATGSTFGTNPYPGAFTEHLEATFGAQTGAVVPNSTDFQGSWGWPTGAITDLSAHFTITSGANTVTGEKQFDASAAPVAVPGFLTNSIEENRGLCRDVGAEADPPDFANSPQLYGYFRTLDAATVSYTATIQNADGSFVDRGRARVLARNACADFVDDGECIANPSVGGSNVGIFAEQFVSDLAAPLPVAHVAADCKKGGWQSQYDDLGRPFANQGDCVSFVATGGKNKAKG